MLRSIFAHLLLRSGLFKCRCLQEIILSLCLLLDVGVYHESFTGALGVLQKYLGIQLLVGTGCPSFLSVSFFSIWPQELEVNLRVRRLLITAICKQSDYKLPKAHSCLSFASIEGQMFE